MIKKISDKKMTNIMTKDKYRRYRSVKILFPIILSAFFFLTVTNSVFAQDQSLQVNKSSVGEGFGSVTMKSATTDNITCDFKKYKNSSYCKANYSSGTNVTLTASAASGSTFIGWGEACSGISPCTVTLNADRSVIAYFTLGGSSSSSSSEADGGGGPYTLTLEKGASNGTGIVGVDSLKDCYLKTAGSSCSYTYPSGTNVALLAAPDSGMTLSWSGACSGTDPNCSITMNNNKTAVADFVPSSDPAPVINFFYADPSTVKTGQTSVLHGQAANISKCHLMSRNDSSVGTSGYPTIYKEWWSQWTSWGIEPYYWRDVDKNFTWSTATLNKDGDYTYRFACRGTGAYDNQFSGIVEKDISVTAMTNVTLNVAKSGGGAGTVKSDTFSSSFAWANNRLVSGGPRYTGYCGAGYSYVKTYSCNSLTVGTKVYDGSDRGSSYGDYADAFPVYDGLKTASAREYTNSCSLGFRSGGTVNEWQCKDKVYDIDCGIMCSASYAFGDNKKIILTATPNLGSAFSKWTGANCEEGTNSGNTCTITMDKARNINAEFSSSGVTTVASWQLEETSGSIKDSTTYANDLTPTGTTVTKGVSGNARNLNNKNEYLTLSSPINFPLGSSARTVDFWVNPSSSLTGTGYVFGYGVGGANQAFGVSVSGGYWWFQGFGGADMNSMIAVVREKWTYVAVTYDGAILKIYINGVLVNSDSRGLNTPSSAFYIGRAPWDSASNFVGAIDEFRVSVGALSASEISNRYSLYAI